MSPSRPTAARIYVSQQGVDVPVLVLDRDGTKVGELKPPAVKGSAVLHTPSYVAIDPTNGDVLVSDRAAKAVYVYSGEGAYIRTLQPAALKATWEPLGIAFAPDGTVYVADVRAKGGQRILAIDGDGNVTRTLTVTATGADPLNYPNAMTVDPRRQPRGRRQQQRPGARVRPRRQAQRRRRTRAWPRATSGCRAASRSTTPAACSSSTP